MLMSVSNLKVSVLLRSKNEQKRALLFSTDKISNISYSSLLLSTFIDSKNECNRMAKNKRKAENLFLQLMVVVIDRPFDCGHSQRDQ